MVNVLKSVNSIFQNAIDSDNINNIREAELHKARVDLKQMLDDSNDPEMVARICYRRFPEFTLEKNKGDGVCFECAGPCYEDDNRESDCHGAKFLSFDGVNCNNKNLGQCSDYCKCDYND